MTLATVTGIIITSFLLFLIMLISISAMMAAGNKPVSIAENSVLVLNTGIIIPDRNNDNPFSAFDPISRTIKKASGLNDILSNINKAKNDPKIKGILIEGGALPSGWATADEIRRALIDFRSSGKFVYAYADYLMTQQSYFIATAADRIWINPIGSLELKGISAEISFYHKALEKLGVEVQVIRHGKFKGAVEPYMLDEMSKDNRSQIAAYIGSIWDHAVSVISESRSIPEKRIREMADSLSSYSISYMTRQGILDGTMYRDQLDDTIRSATGTKEGKKLSFINMTKYSRVPDPLVKTSVKDKIAVIYAAGSIVTGKGDGSNIGGNSCAAELRKVREDSTIKAVVFRINSRGGNAMASDIIWREVSLTSKVKPVIVSMGNYAASGGYYMAAAATKIFASPATITGSIGVFGLIPNFNPLLEDRLGISSEVVGTNTFSDSPSVTRPMSGYEKNMMQYNVEQTYSTFTDVVAEGRKMKKADVDSIGQGRVWSGTDALNLGLVDTLGGLTDAINEAVAMTNLKEYRIVERPEKVDLYTSLLLDLSEDMKLKTLREELGLNVKYLLEMKEILSMEGVQASLPYFVDIH